MDSRSFWFVVWTAGASGLLPGFRSALSTAANQKCIVDGSKPEVHCRRQQTRSALSTAANQKCIVDGLPQCIVDGSKLRKSAAMKCRGRWGRWSSTEYEQMAAWC
jgi:hypothetical protein